MQPVQRLAVALLIVGALSAFAALFGPGEPWGALDVGAMGAVLFTLALVAAVWLFARRGDEVFPEDMSIAERRAAVGLVFITIVLASFIRQLWSLSLHAEVPTGLDGLFAHHYMQGLITLIIAWSLISHFIGARVGGLEADERDRDLRHRADRAGDWALT